MPKLNVTLQDGSQQSFELIESEITVGRLPENTLQIDDISVSSNHAVLALGAGGDYVYRDIGSTNGSRLNGQDLEPDRDHPLQNGDALRMGKVEGFYESENPAEARPLPAEAAMSLAPAASSSAPTNFQNASPFQTKAKKKDPSGTAVMVVAGVAILAFIVALLQVFSLKADIAG